MDYVHLDDIALQSLAVSSDREAEEALCERYMRLVRKCSRPLFLAGGSGEDLIQEGMIGLLSAIRKFDPEGGSSFHYFAEICIYKASPAQRRSFSRATLGRFRFAAIGNSRGFPAGPGRSGSGQREQGRTLRSLFPLPVQNGKQRPELLSGRPFLSRDRRPPQQRREGGRQRCAADKT